MAGAHQQWARYKLPIVALHFVPAFAITWALMIPAVSIVPPSLETLFIIGAAFGPFASALITIRISKGARNYADVCASCSGSASQPTSMPWGRSSCPSVPGRPLWPVQKATSTTQRPRSLREPHLRTSQPARRMLAEVCRQPSFASGI